MFCVRPVYNFGKFQFITTNRMDKFWDSFPYPWSTTANENNFRGILYFKTHKILFEQGYKFIHFACSTINKRSYVLNNIPVLIKDIKGEQFGFNIVSMESAPFVSVGMKGT